MKLLSVEEEENKWETGKLSLADKTILENIRPIKILGSRLSLESMREEQESDEEIARNLKENPGQYEKNEFGLVVTSNGKLVVVPKKLEGVVLSYYHLLCGHSGWNRLHAAVSRKYYFSGCREKSRTISSTCQVCCLSLIHISEPTRPY